MTTFIDAVLVGLLDISLASARQTAMTNVLLSHADRRCIGISCVVAGGQISLYVNLIATLRGTDGFSSVI